MSGQLAGRSAIITGAGDGIGAATARRFADEGCRVLVSDRSGRASALVDELGSDRVVYECVDLTSAEAVPRLVEVAFHAWGRLDIVLANAGVMPVGSIEDHTLEDFRLALEVNSASTFLLVQAASGVWSVEAASSSFRQSRPSRVMPIGSATARPRRRSSR